MKSAVIGLGCIGKLHTDLIEKSGNTLVSVCDIDSNKLNLYPNSSKYTDYVRMLDTENIDVVHICTPHYLHAQMIIEALKRNINVFCEKPLCIKREDIEKILEAERQSKAKLGVCHQNRYNETNLYVKNYLENKKILSAHGTVVWKRDEKYYKQADWRGTIDKEGGGVLINQALHTLDLMQWFCGIPEKIIANLENVSLQGIIEVEDTANIFCYGKNNYTFFATNAGGSDLPVEISISLDNGDFIKVFPNYLLINGKLVCCEEIDFIGKKCCYGNGHRKIIKDFYECICKNKKFAIDGEEGAKVVKMILDCYKR